MNDNALIAEFLGLKLGWWIPQKKPLTDDKKQWCDLSGNTFLGTSAYYTNQLRFHETWEWLLPVLEKIRQVDPKVKFTIAPEEVKIYNKSCKFFEKSHRSTITMTYNVIVSYIKWYNAQK